MLLEKFIIEPTRANILKVVKGTFYNPGIVSEELADKAYQYLVMPKTKDALLNVLRSNISTNAIRPELILTDKLHLAKSPTLIIHGTQDSTIPIGYIQDPSNLIPKVRLKIFQKCAHHPHIEKPGEFNEAVMTFLNSNELHG